MAAADTDGRENMQACKIGGQGCNISQKRVRLEIMIQKKGLMKKFNYITKY
jgi:hypothetical protein